jgi:peptidoglycan/LPS O-acetylase OafA/YrhL
MASPSQQSAPHLARIDVLRAGAILLVLLHHYWVAVQQLPGDRWVAAGWMRMLWAPWEFGYLGVKLFFVISGFCIHLSFLNWRRQRSAGAAFWKPFLAEFFWRRFWRIYPPYLGALLLFYALQYSQPLSFAALRHLGVHGLLLNNLSPAFFLNINPSFWSIAVEWQLYLIYPLFLWLAIATRVEVAFAVASAVAFTFQFAAPHFTESYLVLRSPFAYWFEWVIGAVVAELFVNRRRIFPASPWLTMALGFGAVWVHVFSDSGAAQYVLPTLFFAMLMESWLHAQTPLFRVERWLVPLGLCSYSVYLFHQPYLGWVVKWTAQWQESAGAIPVWLLLPIVAFGPLLLGCWLYYRWVERTSITTGRRIWDARGTERRSG